MSARRFSVDELRITRGALILLFIQVGASLVWLFSDQSTRLYILELTAPTSVSVWQDGKIWTLVTGPLLEPEFISLLFGSLMMWMLVPTLEKFWGTPRLLRFAAMTMLAGTVVGSLAGFATGRQVPIFGYGPFVYACVVAFGTIYARRPVQFFGVLPLTGRQFMYGILAFLVLMVVLNGEWERGAAYLGAIGVTLLITSQRFSPELWWQRFRRRRQRKHLRVVPPTDEASATAKPRGGRKNSEWLN